MYAFDIIIPNNRFQEKHDKQYENWIHLAYSYVYQLDRTRQIAKQDHTVIVDGLTLRIPVVCPELDSLALKNHSSFCRKTREEIEENADVKIKIVQVGVDADNPNYKVPEKSSFFILRTGWESPLLCGDTHQPIPLYKLFEFDPKMDFDDIHFWALDYERLHGLWISGLYEDFAEAELQNHDSRINQQGRVLCRQIEKLTGIPTFLFLPNFRDWSEAEDHNWTCPITHKEWKIDGKTREDFIAFKCDESRLVSELSMNAVPRNDDHRG